MSANRLWLLNSGSNNVNLVKFWRPTLLRFAKVKKMPSKNEVSETQKKRFSVLNAIYVLANLDEQKRINTNEITTKTEIQGEELYQILIFLINEGLIKKIFILQSTLGVYKDFAIISITNKGICELENAIAKPDEPTKNFPAHICNYTYTIIEGNNSGHNVGRIITDSPILEQNNSSIGLGLNQGGIKTDEIKIAGRINESQKPNLDEVVLEIEQLLEQLEKSYQIDTTSQKMKMVVEAIERIERNPSLHQKILSACKEGTVQALAQNFNHPVGIFIIKTFEYWQKN
ncbi:MAG: hypothetical protein M3N42_00375 [Cyanobacteriota bacterium]|nr:hypothetical protein [Cyanobacteriota bacterium]